MDFTYLYKELYSSVDKLDLLNEYDYFISFGGSAERITAPASKIKSRKHIIVIPRSGQPSNRETASIVYEIDKGVNYEVMMELVSCITVDNANICIDSTGFLIPDLLFLIRLLHSKGLKEIDILYAEPVKYKDNEDTRFTDDFHEVKQVYGMAGTHTSETDKDLLIIAAGYDHSRIIDVAYNKKSARKILLYGFPSISPGMFQENVFRAYSAESALGSECFRDMDLNLYAPAYDPFVTAQTIKDYLKNTKYTNLYLSPLSSKPHALGMALFFLWEKGYEKNISIIYPMCAQNYTDYSEGVGRIWRYKFILPGEN